MSNKYIPVENKHRHDSQPEEDYEALLSHGSESSYKQISQRPRSWILFVVTPIIHLSLIGFGVWIGSHWLTNTNAICLEHVQKWCRWPRTVTI